MIPELAHQARVLVAGIGNIFLGDDAFGVEVVRRLAERTLPDDVRVRDFGIRGFDLACALLEPYEVAILVDATPRGGTPGTLYLIEPELEQPGLEHELQAGLEMHNLDPVRVLQLAAAMGKPVDRVLVVGCEPTLHADGDDADAGLSPPVAAAINDAVALVESLATRILCGEMEMANR